MNLKWKFQRGGGRFKPINPQWEEGYDSNALLFFHPHPCKNNYNASHLWESLINEWSILKFGWQDLFYSSNLNHNANYNVLYCRQSSFWNKETYLLRSHVPVHLGQFVYIAYCFKHWLKSHFQMCKIASMDRLILFKLHH